MTKLRSVLIADDERLVRIGLMHTVDWERWRLRVVADAPNGEAAWELYREHKPDLVITDIVMPGLDGIQLAQRIKETDPETKILFLSCHSDFAYAQQGLAIGASGYLLKTAMDTGEMDRYLRKITDEWERAAGGAQEDPNLLYRAWLTDGDGGRLNAELRRRFGERPFSAVGVFGFRDDEELGGWLAQAKALGSGHATFYAAGAPALHFAQQADAERWAAALLALSGRLPHVSWKRAAPEEVADDPMGAAARMMKSAELERLYEVRIDEVSEPIMRAVRHIDGHLHEPIVSSQLAEQVGMSRSHFSTMFKKEIGVSFLEFLHRRRLDKAKELLRDTDWRIHLIGEKIGIEDNRHFSKWFRRYTGMTPSDYRENNRTTVSDKLPAPGK